MDQEKVLKLQEMIDDSHRIVFFGGAGVSTESNIPDFRSTDGLYNQTYKYPPEVMVSHTFYIQHTEEFYEFYKNKMLFLDAKPNKAHKKLAELEKAGKLTAVVTQNIDGLHQKAGSHKVYELHSTEVSTEIIVSNVINFLTQNMWQQLTECRIATPVEG